MSNNPEDLKLATLAMATMARSGSSSAAALRDKTGRTYVAIPVASDGFEIDALLSVLVVAKASQITGIEAIVIAGDKPDLSSQAVIVSEDATAKLFMVDSAGILIALN